MVCGSTGAGVGGHGGVPGGVGTGDGADHGGCPWYGSGWPHSSDIHDKRAVPGPLQWGITANGLSRDLYSGESLQIGCPGPTRKT